MTVKDRSIRTNRIGHTVPGVHQDVSMVTLDDLHIAVAGLCKDKEGSNIGSIL